MPDYTDNELPVTFARVRADVRKKAQVVHRRDLFAAHALSGLLASGQFEMHRDRNPESHEFYDRAYDLAHRADILAGEMESLAALDDDSLEVSVKEEFAYWEAEARKLEKATAKND